MNIMVFDVPAENGGALSILNDFYEEAKSYRSKDINWFFVVSKPEIQETYNIKVLRFPWVKKSWWHRLFFDHFIAPKLINKYNIDKALSFQNVIIPHTNVQQVLYVHQPLSFVKYKFSLKENKLFWIYQNIISLNIINSIKKADKVIVQTKWMKSACIEKSNVLSEKIKIVPPQINIDINNFFQPNEVTLSNFFYPAGVSSYKNHKIIIEACKKLLKESVKNYKIIVTLKGDENNHIYELYKEAKKYNLPIQFVGNLPREKVFDLYTKSILLFPSYIETFGLPLLEARLHKGLILASDSPFSHEILDGYENAHFFDPFNEIELARLIEDVLNKKIEYHSIDNKENTRLVVRQSIPDLIV